MKTIKVVLRLSWHVLVLGLCGASQQAVAMPQAWVLVLSWSPQYCDKHSTSKEPQCTDGYFFMPRALTPEVALSGDCATKAGPTESQISRLMPVVGNRRELLGHWFKEGGCVEMPFEDYVVKLDFANRRVNVPDAYRQAETRQRFKVDEIRQQFIDANPGLAPSGVALHCAGRELSEVSICLSSGLTFQNCSHVEDDCSGEVMIRGLRNAGR